MLDWYGYLQNRWWIIIITRSWISFNHCEFMKWRDSNCQKQLTLRLLSLILDRWRSTLQMHKQLDERIQATIEEHRGARTNPNHTIENNISESTTAWLRRRVIEPPWIGENGESHLDDITLKALILVRKHSIILTWCFEFQFWYLELAQLVLKQTTKIFYRTHQNR